MSFTIWSVTVIWLPKLNHASLLQQKEKQCVRCAACYPHCNTHILYFVLCTNWSMHGWLWTMYSKQMLWRIIPFQLSVGNVKIIIRRDSSVGRQHLFIMVQGWGGTVATSRLSSVHHRGVLFLALLVHDFFILHYGCATLTLGLLMEHLPQVWVVVCSRSKVSAVHQLKECYLDIKSLHTQYFFYFLNIIYI